MAMVGYDYGTGAYATQPLYYECGTSTSTAIEYGYEDCTTTGSTGRIFVPTTKRRVQWATNTATSSCTWDTWERAEDECGIVWEGWGASNTVYKVVKWSSYGSPEAALTPEQKEKLFKDKIKRIMHERCSPNIIVRNSKRQALEMPKDIREQRARETLRRVVGDQKFVNFVKHGFISVKARSGLTYQIFTGHGITHVFNQGNLVERLCVVLQGDFPPTDSLIMRYLLILNNEQQFRSLAVKHSVDGYQTGRSRHENGPAVIQPLAEIFKELKKVA